MSPKDIKGLVYAFNTAQIDQIWTAIKFPVMRSAAVLNERSAESHVTTRERLYNQKFEEWSPEGPEREKHWSVLEKAFTTMKTWYDKTERKWLMGDTFSYANILAVSGLFMFKWVLCKDEWKRITTWHDGYWERLLVEVERECMVI